MSRLSRWAASLHVGQLVMLTALSAIVAVFGTLGGAMLMTDTGACQYCRPAWEWWVGLPLLVSGLAAAVVTVSAWWSWFGARRR